MKTKTNFYYRKWTGALAVLAFLFVSHISMAQCPTVNVVDDPPQFQWTYHPVTANNPEAYYSGVMEVGEVTLNMNNGTTFKTRAYRQEGTAYSIPGPTINMQPGNKYVLQLHNTLPYTVPDASHNVFKDPDIVNIHTHGLHISGESPGDDVTRAFEGGRGGDFVWDIPADHMGGTFWYHAHHHGSTYLQVSGGMFGMMIVDDSNDGIPAPVAAMEERQIVFGLLDVAAAGTGGDTLMGGTMSTTWTTNGVIGGNICMPPNTWQHWRVLVADRGAMLRDVEFGPECEVMLLSRDGVWRTVAPRELASNGNGLMLTGASRADFAIRATGNSTVSMGGNVIANIHVNGTADPVPHPFDTDGVSQWSANRPSYLRDLRNEPVVNTENVSMGARTVNGSKFDHHQPTFTMDPTDVQEWSLSGNVRHPFHLHIYHVQALDDDRDFEAGEYYDVVASQMNVRFDLNAATSTPYAGRTIMHCHVLQHEDQGAMGWLNVVNGGQPAPTFPVDGDITDHYSDYYIIGGGTQTPPAAPTALGATAVSTSAIDLAWTDNATDEDGFNIERSADGVSFSFIASVGADVTSYTDNGLNAATTYYYQVTAYNAVGGSSASNIANATTLTGGPSTPIHVDNITVGREALNGNRFRGISTVTIVDDMGAAVSGATVNVSYTGPNSGTRSGTTDAAGQVSFNTNGIKNPSGEWCFEVTNVTKTGTTYASASNVVTIACESGPQARTGRSNVKGEGDGSMIVTEHGTGIQPEVANLLGVYPNPLQDETKILFQLAEAGEATLEVYSMVGDLVTVIANQKFEAGQHLFHWETAHLHGGSYILILRVGEKVETKKLTIIR